LTDGVLFNVARAVAVGWLNWNVEEEVEEETATITGLGVRVAALGGIEFPPLPGVMKIGGAEDGVEESGLSLLVR
jgi:hypothetical protein